MQALCCNRCKRFFNPFDSDEYSVLRFQNPVIVEYNTPQAKNSPTGTYTYPLFGNDPWTKNGDYQVDLCEKCKFDFIHFMAGIDVRKRSDAETRF